ncbi:spry domain protein [Ichthyophthirius multifiliis]|uniref:Spry domain protein n=1 Tax=Ichthyophthirius multifiliis TaxID=5932 RepID=G0QPR1_ICHMU|nr:spry domain protein [Ichthyophthirius multifiliis]EGR32776.1 spry domain protein [Ichthyophthirius multifiliis]|eukprot:XP_004036762.1 spry domain protein [Ichthyophthirius multifiliis]
MDSRTENELKIGVSTSNQFQLNTAFCDTNIGFAYYGLGCLRHGDNSNGKQYGKQFKKQGVLGVFLNMKKGQLSFALNGEYYGIGFESESLKKGPIWPAVALLHIAGCKIQYKQDIPKYFIL